LEEELEDRVKAWYIDATLCFLGTDKKELYLSEEEGVLKAGGVDSLSSSPPTRWGV